MIILGVIFVLFIGLGILGAILPDTEVTTYTLEEAPYLADDELTSFYKSLTKFESNEYTGSVKEIFYSDNQQDGFKVDAPKKLPQKDGSTTYAIIISGEEDKPGVLNTVVYLRPDKNNSKIFISWITQNMKNGEPVSYNNISKMNPVLLSIYPTGYFETIAADLENQKEKLAAEKAEEERRKAEEYEKTHTPEGWPKDSIYTSSLLIRRGIDDVQARVGDIFYSSNNNDLLIVKAPVRSGDEYLIAIASQDSGNLSAINIYLKYNTSRQESIIEKISIKNNGKTETFTSFEDKYYTLLTIAAMFNQ